jgi:hypothetical protein
MMITVAGDVIVGSGGEEMARQAKETSKRKMIGAQI